MTSSAASDRSRESSNEYCVLSRLSLSFFDLKVVYITMNHIPGDASDVHSHLQARLFGFLKFRYNIYLAS